jgi:hypothetical protein
MADDACAWMDSYSCNAADGGCTPGACGRTTRKLDPRESMIVRSLSHQLVTLLLSCCAFAPALADPNAEHGDDHVHPTGGLLLFTSAEAHRLTPSASSRDMNEDAPLAADIVFSAGHERLRLFGEFLVSRAEHDLERLQLGYEAAPDTMVWLGRFHQPASAWNLEHHHGRYLQTAVTRPSIELWEDERGVLPQHLVGMLVESRHALGDEGGLRYALGTGLGVAVERDGLEPIDLLHARRHGRQVSWTGRLAYLPQDLESTQFGVVAARHRIPVNDPVAGAALGATPVRQDVAGVFADWRLEQWRVAGTLYDVHVAFAGGAAARREHFLVGYLQVERQLPRGLTAYAREENSHGARSSTFVTTLSPNFVLSRTSLGLRWDWQRHQAVTVECGNGVTPRARQSDLRLLWSAVFP